MASIRLKDSGGKVYIGRGWREICIGNSLGLKDCVKLELIGNGITPIFKLYSLLKKSCLSIWDLFSPNITDQITLVFQRLQATQMPKSCLIILVPTLVVQGDQP